MSRITLSGNASGTGNFTLASPNSNTDRTLTLPDATGTVNVSGLANEVPAGSAGAPAIYPTGDTNTGIFFPAADTIAFTEGGTESMRIDSSGNLLVGTTTASAKLTINSNAGGSSYLSGEATSFRTGGNTNNPNGRGLVAAFNAGGAGDAANTYGASITIGASSVGVMAIQHKPGAPFAIADFFPGGTYVGDGNPPTERLRVDGSGNLLVGTTAAINVFSGTTDGVSLEGAGTVVVSRNGSAAAYLRRRSTNGEMVVFLRDTTDVGSIDVTTTSTSYNTSSDYRLKEDWQPMSGASERLMDLKPVNFAWKVDGSRVDGFLAHEAQAVVPEAVTGEKDQVQTIEIKDEDGNVTGTEEQPVYQGIDQSKLVPLLTAALQEALTEIASMKARITALEAN